MYLRQNPFPSRRPFAGSAASGQRGVVLLVALIILVALTLAGVALLRSVDTANLIAGNLSFHQAAIHAGERSTELAITNWLEPNNSLGDPDLHDNSAGNGYRAMREDPPGTDSWDKFWTDTLAAQAVAGTPDAAGNTVSYVIHRLCDGVGAPHVVNCAKSPA
ncbi:MAG: hypothetical protein KDI64_01005, partial [Candidatus Accumulibacter sp.]|nr:hypothetical protein [Accumulibacter sp.]